MFISILPPSLILLVGRSQRYNLNHITLKRWILIFYVLDFLEWLVFANSVMCSYFQGRLIANDAFHAHFIIDWLWTIIVVSMIKHFAVLNQLKRNQWNENYFVRCVLILRGEVKMCFFSFIIFKAQATENRTFFFSLCCAAKNANTRRQRTLLNRLLLLNMSFILLSNDSILLAAICCLLPMKMNNHIGIPNVLKSSPAAQRIAWELNSFKTH